MSILPGNFMKAVVALGTDSMDGSPQKFWFGTGFIVSYLDACNVRTYYLITNKHVVNHRQQLYVRFNCTSGQFVQDHPLTLNVNGTPAFSAHPNPSTDIVAIQLSEQFLNATHSIWGHIALDTEALTLDQMAATGVDEGALVYALGFPMNLVSDIKAPICRMGCISRIMDTFIAPNDYPTFLVDAQSFPGNSGGPIINRPEHLAVAGTSCNGSANLIGILSAFIPYRDTLVSQQTGEIRMVATENSGLTVVHPVDRIKEVVLLDWERHRNSTMPNTQ